MTKKKVKVKKTIKAWIQIFHDNTQMIWWVAPTPRKEIDAKEYGGIIIPCEITYHI